MRIALFLGLALATSPVASSEAKKPPAPAKETKSRGEYLGPAGLRWGMSVDEVKTHLSKRFRLQDVVEDDSETTLVFSGDFAGFRDSEIEASFLRGKLGMVAVLPPPKGNRKAVVRWRELIAAVEKQHGKPDELTPEPEVEHGAALLLDVAIETGDWTPMASWRFANGVAIVATVQSSDVDEKGRRVLQPVLLFLKRDVVEKALSETPSDI